MRIELEEDKDKLNLEIEELLKVKNMLINSSSYKSLYGKTTAREQGEQKQERIRSRLEHSENVSPLAQEVVARIYDECATEEQKKSEIFILNKTKELLYTEIGSLAHDLGHTPFGHDGEKSISQFMEGVDDREEIDRMIQKRIQCFGRDYEEQQGHMGKEVALSFEHNEQSALLFYELLHNGEINLDCIDANRIIQIILSHSRKRVRKCPKDLVAQVVRHMDTVESRIMDFCEISEYIKLEQFENKSYAQKSAKEKMDIIKEELVREAIEKGKIDDKMKALNEVTQFREDYKEAIYFLDLSGGKGLLTSENIERNRVIISKLLEYYYTNSDEMHTKYYTRVTPINLEIEEKIHSVHDTLQSKDKTGAEKAVDFIISMDNERARKEYLRLVKQRIVTGKGIEPITPEEIKDVKRSQQQERIEQWRGKQEQSHTVREARNIIRDKDANFVQELTPEGIETILETRRKIKEDAELDSLLYKEMEKADCARKERREVIDIEGINQKLGETPKLSEEERRKKSAIQLKEKWQKKQVSPDNKHLKEER